MILRMEHPSTGLIRWTITDDVPLARAVALAIVRASDQACAVELRPHQGNATHQFSRDANGQISAWDSTTGRVRVLNR